MYIFEWPARMAVACMWPGLPFVDSQTDSIQRQFGINYLALPPQLSALVFKYQLPEVCSIPALLTWRNSVSTSWLLFDKTPHDQLGFTLHGRFFKMALYPIPHCADEVNDTGTIPYVYDEDTDSDLYDEMFEGRYLSALIIHIHAHLLLQGSMQNKVSKTWKPAPYTPLGLHISRAVEGNVLNHLSTQTRGRSTPSNALMVYVQTSP